MFYASCQIFKAYLSPTKLVESCKVHLLLTGFLDWNACLHRSDHDQSTPETDTYSINDKNVAPGYQPQDEMHPLTPAATLDPVEAVYFQTELYTPFAPLKIKAFEEYGGVATELGQRVIGIFFWADFGKRIGSGHVALPPKMSAKSIPPEAWSLVQHHLDTA